MSSSLARVMIDECSEKAYPSRLTLSYAHEVTDEKADLSAETDIAWQKLLQKANSELQHSKSYTRKVTPVFGKPKQEEDIITFHWSLDPIGFSTFTNKQGNLVILVSALCFQKRD